jgi:KaiC/GvpD/RAD55 family RecA-like ATPase
MKFLDLFGDSGKGKGLDVVFGFVVGIIVGIAGKIVAKQIGSTFKLIDGFPRLSHQRNGHIPFSPQQSTCNFDTTNSNLKEGITINTVSNDIKKGTIDIVNEPYLLCDKSIHRREMACLVSAPGVGKTLLACFIAKEASNHNLSIVYFNLDDTSDNQYTRLASIPSATIITCKEFDKNLNAIRTSATEYCQTRAITDSLTDKVMGRYLVSPIAIENRKRMLMKDLGIGNKQKVDELLLFEILSESEICFQADIVILDSLNALLGSEFRIDRRCLERITGIFKDRGQTLIILHHTNKKNEIAGNGALSQVLDTVIQIDYIKDNYRRISEKKCRYKEKWLEYTVEMITEGPHSVRFDLVDEASVDQGPKFAPLERKVIAVLSGRETITLAELRKLCPSSKGGLKNSLKKLEDIGYLAKADGETWNIIRNCKILNL